MSKEGSPIGWNKLEMAGKDGWFMDLLEDLPREQWAVRDHFGRTLLHFACYGSNLEAVKLLLNSGLIDINARTGWGSASVETAASFSQVEIVEMLLAANAQIRSIDLRLFCRPPYNESMQTKHIETMHMLIANGVRFNTAGSDHYSIQPKLEEFQRGVLHCRTKVVALLCVKRAGNLWRWDKFLLKEVAIAVWATRYEAH